MYISKKVTSTLAWVGLAVVIGVPAAELVSSKLIPSDAAATDVVAPVASQAPKASVIIVRPKPAAAEQATVVPAPQPARPAVAVQQAVAQLAPAPAPAPVAVASADDSASVSAVPADPVKDYLASGKPLPSYLTPTKSEASAAAAPAAAAAPIAGPAEVASLPVAETEAQPEAASPAAPAPLPVATRPKRVAPTATEADLKDWKSGTLEDYLRSHNLLGSPSASGGDN